MNSFNYFIPTKVLFGPGKLNELAKEPLPGSRALIVVSGGTSMKKYGYLERVQGLLKQQGVDSVVFDKILPNPILAHVTEGAQLAKAEKCDFIIGLGGGSSIDSAKSIAVMAKNSGNYWDYVHGGSGKGQPIKNGVLPIVAITTTAGTGTEADPWTVITHEERNEKIGFGTEATFPTLSIVDPELMVSVPPHLTAYQGFDALFHAVEGYIANIASPVSDGFALSSIELIAKSLAAAVKDGSNIQARTDIALANTLSGFVESTSSCTSEHSMEHAMSAFYPALPHGAGLIMLSEAYFSFFEDKIPEKFARMASAMGMEAEPGNFVKALMKLQKDCGVDQLKMSDYGISKEEIGKLAENAKFSMGGLFDMDSYSLSMAETVSIMEAAYK
ncbi:MAG: iron-containing alcohol dehydrogenase [Spirochaetales bacterium]|nr:iron-containing alcohol dehydrogenase [Spirochaetales bacterium]